MPVKVKLTEPKAKFLLNPGKKNTFYKGVFKKHEWFEDKYAGYYFTFVILSDYPLKDGEPGDTSFGKELRITFWATQDDATKEWGFPKKGKFVNTCDILAESKGFDPNHDDYDIEDLYGGLVEFQVVNNPSKKDASIEYSNIDSDTISGIRDSELEDVKKALERYKKEWKVKKESASSNDRASVRHGESLREPAGTKEPERPSREPEKPSREPEKPKAESRPSSKRKNPMENGDDELPF